jgi:hypothetical protein
MTDQIRIQDQKRAKGNQRFAKRFPFEKSEQNRQVLSRELGLRRAGGQPILYWRSKLARSIP